MINIKDFRGKDNVMVSINNYMYNLCIKNLMRCFVFSVMKLGN